jgi:hypothetical protein
MPKGAMPKATSDEIKSEPAAGGLRTVLKLQRVGSQRYFDAAGFPGRTVGLDAEPAKDKDSKEKRAAK